MKGHFLLIVVSLIVSEHSLAAEAAPDRPMQRVAAMLKRLHEARKPEDYTTADYFAELQAVGKEVREEDPKRVEKLDAAVPADAANAVLKLAVDFQDQDAERARELGAKYGHYEKREGPGPSFRGFPQAPELMPDHVKPVYLKAWEAWLMAPPSREREMMANRILMALEPLGDEGAIPLFKEIFGIEADRIPDAEGKTRACTLLAGQIDITPGPAALDALLECNRLAIAGGFAGEGYEGSSRAVVRRLASREPMADEMIDPKYRDMLIEAGRLKNPEDIPLRGDHWKIYKPLVEARLKAAEEGSMKVPPEDLAVLKAAMEIMPKE